MAKGGSSTEQTGMQVGNPWGANPATAVWAGRPGGQPTAAPTNRFAGNPEATAMVQAYLKSKGAGGVRAPLMGGQGQTPTVAPVKKPATGVMMSPSIAATIANLQQQVDENNRSKAIAASLSELGFMPGSGGG